MELYSLDRFVEAQAHSYRIALAEVRAGRKRSHWMWYIFPQLRGLGSSAMAHAYGISGVEEAIAYMRHPLLSARLLEITEALLEHTDKTAREIFGEVDAMKLRSSMTLFALVSAEGSPFSRVLEAFYGGEADEATLSLV